MSISISVIVPVYNVEKYLERCLNSLVSQTLTNIEIIVVNDGSPDSSQSIIDDFKTNYADKIVALTKPNGGLGDARNFGLPYAKGEYIGFLDSDDYVDANAYEKLYQAAMQNKADLVVSDILYEWEGTQKSHRLKGLSDFNPNDVQKSLMLSPLFAWNKIYRRDLFDRLAFQYPNRLWYEDIPVTIPFISVAKTFAYVPEPLFHYIQRGTSIMGSRNSNKLFDIFEILDMTLEALEKRKSYERFKMELEYLHIEQLMLYGSFRFFRSQSSKDLMDHAFKVMVARFPNWKSNAYITSLSWKYRLYLNLLSPQTASLFDRLLKMRDRLLEKGNL